MSRPFQVRQDVPLANPDIAVIAGIKCYVYGLSAVDSARPITLAVVLHPRTLSQEYSRVLASEIVTVPNVVAVAFDLPNHGSRTIDDRANQDWKIGNPTHGQDLATCIELAASEAEVIARYVPSYFPVLERAAASGDLYRVAVGASLGGHIAWRIAIGPHGPQGSRLFQGIVPIIGSPFVGDMLQKRVAQSEDNPDLPLSTILNLDEFRNTRELADCPQFRILALCGAKDKYVPASYTQQWAASNTNPNQKVIIDENAGHWTSPFMVEHLVQWFSDLQATYQRDTSQDLPVDEPLDVQVLSAERPYDEDN